MKKKYLMPTIELDEIVVENGIAGSDSPLIFDDPGANPDANDYIIDGWN